MPPIRFAPPTTTSTVAVPGGIDATGATDVRAALMSFIAGLPNGTRITASPSAIYKISSGIRLTGRQHLVFDWPGTTLYNTGGGGAEDGCFYLDTCQDIALLGIDYIGNNATPGFMSASGEHSATLYVSGGARIEMSGGTSTNVHGDATVTVNRNGQYVWVHDMVVANGGRMAAAVVWGSHVWVERNVIGPCGFACLDIEPESASNGQTMTNINFLDNDLWGWSMFGGVSWHGFMFGASAGVGSTATVTDTHVERNRVTGPTPNQCNLQSYIGSQNTPFGRRIGGTIVDNTSAVAGPIQQAQPGLITFNHCDNWQYGRNTPPPTAGAMYGFVDCTGMTQVSSGATGTAASAFGWSSAAAGNAQGSFTGVAASAFGYATAAAGVVGPVEGPAASAFGWSVTSSGTVLDAPTGVAASAFGWGAAAFGNVADEPVIGTAASAFGWSSDAVGDIGPIPQTGVAASSFGWATDAFGASTGPFVGVGASQFGWATDAFGNVADEPATGIAASAFGWTDDAAGIVGVNATGAAASAFGWEMASAGTAEVPAVVGVAASAFGWEMAASGIEGVDILGEAASAFGWTMAASGGVEVFEHTGVAASAFGWRSDAVGITGESVIGDAASAFGWGTGAIGTSVGQDVTGVAASAFGWAPWAIGNRPKGDDHPGNVNKGWKDKGHGPGKANRAARPGR